MNDLIERQAAIDVAKEELDNGTFYDIPSKIEYLPSAQPDLDEWCTDCSEYDQHRHCCPRWNRVIRQTLKDAQPERKKGKWILCCDDALYWNCSCCGELSDYKYRFCPYCGADMRGENE